MGQLKLAPWVGQCRLQLKEKHRNTTQHSTEQHSTERQSSAKQLPASDAAALADRTPGGLMPHPRKCTNAQKQAQKQQPRAI